MHCTNIFTGLSLGSVLQMIRANPKQCASLLLGKKSQDLSASAMQEIITYDYNGEPGSNERTAEETVVQGWITFLQATEGTWLNCLAMT